jgi:hypothetical protein
MSFNKTPLHVFPYTIPFATGDIEPIRLDPQYPIVGTPTASLRDKETGTLITPNPVVELGDTIAGSGSYPAARPEVIVTLTVPQTIGLYELRVRFVGSSGRQWSILLGIPVIAK